MPNLPVKGVSDELLKTIQSIFQEDLFKDFRLGGGTSLALKHNHRISVDIDLFTDKVFDYNQLNNIVDLLKNKFKDDIHIQTLNFGNTEFPKSPVAFIKAEIPSLNTKLDIMQGIPLLKDVEICKGIPMVHDDDIGSMKLLAAADRGTRKDFIDLILLTNEKPLEHYFDVLKVRATTFKGIKNLFDDTGNKPSNLVKNITPLADFNKAADESSHNNKLIFTQNSSVNHSWFNIQQIWGKRVQELASKKAIPFSKTLQNRGYKRKGFSM
jgi:hypothetical protein